MGFISLKNFVLDPLMPSPNYAKLQPMDFMDVPEEAIEELRAIGRDLIPDVPGWVGEDVGARRLAASAAASDGKEASLVNQDSDNPSA